MARMGLGMNEADELLTNLYVYLLRSWTGEAEAVTVLLTVEARIGEYVLSQIEARGVTMEAEAA